MSKVLLFLALAAVALCGAYLVWDSVVNGTQW